MNNSAVTFLITYNSHPWIMFSFNWLIIICRGGGGEFIWNWMSKVRSRGWKISKVDRQEVRVCGGRGGVLKIEQFSWASICIIYEKTWKNLIKICFTTGKKYLMYHGLNVLCTFNLCPTPRGSKIFFKPDIKYNKKT